ncbi:hypothetical protein CHCC20335_0326 [Bacillus paralicheniformis]|nr:hypothetical protein CHCC20335_0326 [Bacillus paralicheniformis]
MVNKGQTKSSLHEKDILSIMFPTFEEIQTGRADRYCHKYKGDFK